MNKESEENGLQDRIGGLIGDATKNLSDDQKELLASGILKLIGEWIRADVTERGGVLDGVSSNCWRILRTSEGKKRHNEGMNRPFVPKSTSVN